MITIKSETNRFVMYENGTPLAQCRYDKNEIFPLECKAEITPCQRTALYKAVLSKIEKDGYGEAVCKAILPEIEGLGFDKAGVLNLAGYFVPCKDCNKSCS